MLKAILRGSSLAVLLALGGCFVEGQADTGTTVAARGGVYVRPEPVVVSAPPPPPQVTVETRPAQTVVGSVWVDGYWDNQGGSWIWVGGHWDTPPQNGYVWTAPVGVQVDGGFRYHGGYWRPQNEPVDPRYTGNGVVCVGVGCNGYYQQPQGGVVVNTPPQGGYVQQGGGVVVNGGGGYQQPQGGVVVNTPPQGGYVQQGGGVVVNGGGGYQQPQGGVVVNGGGGTVQQPQGGGVVAVGGVRGGTVQAGTVQQPQGGGVVAVGGVRGGTVQAGTVQQPGTMANGGVRGGVQAGTVQQPNVVTNGGVRGGVQAGTVQQPNVVATGGVRGGVQAGTVQQPIEGVGGVRGGVQAGTVPVSCRIGLGTALRGGQYVVNGSGFQQGAHVLIGGTYAPVGSITPTAITVQIPNTTGGLVELEQNGARTTCGNIRVTGS